MRYFVKDKTVNDIIFKNTVGEMVNYLEEVCNRFHKKSRKTFMIDMESIGHGYDDPTGINFTELMGNDFEIGVIKSDGRLVRTNIHEHDRNVKYRDVMGD